MMIHDDYRPGLISQMIGLHMRYYAPDWGFGAAFEAKLAAEAGAFLSAYAPGRDLMLSVWQNTQLHACLFIDGSGRDEPGNRLRWFITAAEARGAGLGGRLMTDAMTFCDRSTQDLTWLTTFSGLDAAAALYRRFGFRKVAENDIDQWQGGVREQRYERIRQDL